MKFSVAPRGQTNTSGITQPETDLPPVTTQELEKWSAHEEKHRPELDNWSRWLNYVLEKWKSGTTLSRGEVKFLMTSSTAVFDPPENLLTEMLKRGIDITPLEDAARRLVLKTLDAQEVQVEQAWRKLERAFVRQVWESHCARLSSNMGCREWLDEFCEALEQLKKVVEKHSGRPSKKRASDEPERDRIIHRLRTEGKEYKDIVRELPKYDPRWRLTAKSAQAQESRYRERDRKFLRTLLQDVFSGPP